MDLKDATALDEKMLYKGFLKIWDDEENFWLFPYLFKVVFGVTLDVCKIIDM